MGAAFGVTGDVVSAVVCVTVVPVAGTGESEVALVAPLYAVMPPCATSPPSRADVVASGRAWIAASTTTPAIIASSVASCTIAVSATFCCVIFYPPVGDAVIVAPTDCAAPFALYTVANHALGGRFTSYEYHPADGANSCGPDSTASDVS